MFPSRILSWFQYPSILNGHFNDFGFTQVDQDNCPDQENLSMDQMGERDKNKSGQKPFSGKRTAVAEEMMKKKMTKEEKIRAAEEKKLQREVRTLDHTDSVPSHQKDISLT